MVLHFGKYQGHTISDVPLPYLFFLSGYYFRKGKRSPLPDDNYAFNYVLENYPDVVEDSRQYLDSLNVMKKPSRNCLYCGRKLVPIISDWKHRAYHKKCWKEMDENDSHSVSPVDSPCGSPIGSPRSSHIGSPHF